MSITGYPRNLQEPYPTYGIISRVLLPAYLLEAKSLMNFWLSSHIFPEKFQLTTCGAILVQFSRRDRLDRPYRTSFH
jgi:hypothetical protein